jgi:hypothetical protein
LFSSTLYSTFSVFFFLWCTSYHTILLVFIYCFPYQRWGGGSMNEWTMSHKGQVNRLESHIVGSRARIGTQCSLHFTIYCFSHLN